MVEQYSSTAILDSPVEHWDYLVLSIHVRTDQQLQEKLCEKGQEGWELISMDTPMAMEYHCIFKRRM